MSKQINNGNDIADEKGSLMDAFRQLWFPAEFRIQIPPLQCAVPEPAQVKAEAETEVVEPVEVEQPPAAPVIELEALNRQISDFATCLWYLKTRYFKTEWGDESSSGDDPRTRSALRRIQKSIDGLRDAGVEIQDPVNKRYPPGSEGMMRPLQMIPADGVEVETVVETTTPVVFRDDQLIQRAEVIVALPKMADVTTNAQQINTTNQHASDKPTK